MILKLYRCQSPLFPRLLPILKQSESSIQTRKKPTQYLFVFEQEGRKATNHQDIHGRPPLHGDSPLQPLLDFQWYIVISTVTILLIWSKFLFMVNLGLMGQIVILIKLQVLSLLMIYTLDTSLPIHTFDISDTRCQHIRDARCKL